MALIRCPECGKEISDKAPQCIHCGFQINNKIKRNMLYIYEKLQAKTTMKLLVIELL